MTKLKLVKWSDHHGSSRITKTTQTIPVQVQVPRRSSDSPCPDPGWLAHADGDGTPSGPHGPLPRYVVVPFLNSHLRKSQHHYPAKLIPLCQHTLRNSIPVRPLPTGSQYLPRVGDPWGDRLDGPLADMAGPSDGPFGGPSGGPFGGPSGGPFGGPFGGPLGGPAGGTAFSFWALPPRPQAKSLRAPWGRRLQ